jgi:hypothetical protein
VTVTGRVIPEKRGEVRENRLNEGDPRLPFPFYRIEIKNLTPMDFRAVKIILALFLFIAFTAPLLRLSVAMPKKGKETSTLAMAGSNIQSDSTTSATPIPLAEQGD